MESSDSDIHDHSTLRGKVYRFWTSIQWKKVFALLGVVLLIILLGTVIGEQAVESQGIASINDYTLVNGSLKFTGNQTTFPQFPGFDANANPTLVKSITLEYVTVDAVTFSRSLQNFTNLISLKFEEVFITKSFQRTYIPKLKEFQLIQLISATEELETYRDSTSLKSNIFFDTVAGGTWNFTDICNLGVDISYMVNGTKLLTVLRNSDKSGLIELDVPICNDILSGVSGEFANLSLANCTVTDSWIPRDLQYLNLHNVTFNNQIGLQNLLKSLMRIEYLLAFLPVVNIDFSDIPKTLTHLSLNSIQLILSSKDNSVLPKVTQFTIANSVLPPELYDSLSTVLPVLQNIAAFGSKTANYRLLQAALQTKAVIIMEDFNRIPQAEEEHEIERTLNGHGIQISYSDFVISVSTSSEEVHVTPLSTNDSFQYGYYLLGYDQFLSYSEFLKIQTEIVTGDVQMNENKLVNLRFDRYLPT